MITRLARSTRLTSRSRSTAVAPATPLGRPVPGSSHGGSRRWALGAALALTALMPAAVASAAGFGPVRTVAAGGVPDLSAPPTAAVGSAGDWAVVWGALSGHTGRLYVRRAAAHGRLGRAERLDAHFPIGTSVALAADGTTTVAWISQIARGREQVRVVSARRGRRFGRATVLASARIRSFGGVTVAAGRTTVAWRDSRSGAGSVAYAISDRGAPFVTHRFSAAAIGSLDNVAADADGDVVIAYSTTPSQPPGAAPLNGQSATVVMPRASTTFSAPQLISQDTAAALPGSESVAARLYAGPGGLAAGFAVEGVLPWLLRVAPLGPNLAFAAPVTVGTVGNSTGNHGFFGPAVALPAIGQTVAAWAPYDTGCGECEVPKTGELDVAARTPDGTFATPQQLSRTVSGYVQAAATDDLAIIAWGEGRFNQERLRYALHTPTGTYSAPRTLDHHVLRDAALAGAGHHAVIAWISGHSIRAATMTG